ncbi:hypothetical protein [Marinomonas sp. GJ51-6]|uniref:hypothetical protein n=1 Tax=Marinomonas sp. GJ51-6 TaxID=2992802 RepID=UPI0029341511|nr:hypothetical protein [Marinomonas sp. GJ51-6]WOD08872.1 hypothetical protein ONZ50_07425 [Marinomonas sp. GJ51-6]
MEALPDHQQSQRIRVVHLADHSGRLQVLFPESNMLDIAAVSRITKRRLESRCPLSSIGRCSYKTQ